MNRRPIWIIIILVGLMMLSGTLVYTLIEGWSLLDSLYMTVNVLTTVGFNEITPLSRPGKIFTIFFAVSGFLLWASAISVISGSIIQNYILRDRRHQKMLKKISNMKDHFIICGSGKVGRHVIRAMKESRRKFVVIDTEEKYQGSFYEELHILPDQLFVKGDATREETLLEANISHAYGLVSCLPEDHQNLFIALTAKKLNPQVHISTYVKEEINISKFYHVGVDEVVSGDFVIGKRLATSLLNKNVAAFLEQTVMLGEDEAFFLGDVVVRENSPVIGRSIRGADIFRQIGLLIFALKRSDSPKYIYNPDPDTILRTGDVLMTFGSESDIARLEKYINK